MRRFDENDSRAFGPRGRFAQAGGPWGAGDPWGPGGFGPGAWGGAMGPRGRRGRGPGRAGRGDVRLAILALLREQPMHGYQVMQELAERSNGAWRPSPGSVYPTLQLLADAGLVEAVEADGRKVFQLTVAGQEHVAELGAQVDAPWAEVAREADNSWLELRDLMGQVFAAVRQVAHAGTPQQVERAKQILTEARRGLYHALADDGSGEQPPAG